MVTRIDSDSVARGLGAETLLQLKLDFLTRTLKFYILESEFNANQNLNRAET